MLLGHFIQVASNDFCNFGFRIEEITCFQSKHRAAKRNSLYLENPFLKEEINHPFSFGSQVDLSFSFQIYAALFFLSLLFCERNLKPPTLGAN